MGMNFGRRNNKRHAKALPDRGERPIASPNNEIRNLPMACFLIPTYVRMGEEITANKDREKQYGNQEVVALARKGNIQMSSL